ncbi:MAG TPA: hypothetical protein VL738_40280 [Dactylosporangium sp.]|nr:hypothetical protein [Dactylosporangium sp.]
MRYLTQAFALGALRRGKAIEQFLGPVEVDGVAGVRWVAVSSSAGKYSVTVHTVQDLDDDEFLDMANFPPLDPVDEEYAGQGRELGRHDDPGAAVELAERLTGAVPERWVNFAVVGEEYADFVRSRRQQL